MTIEEAIELVKRVCRKLDIDFDILKSKSRKRVKVMQRRAFMYLLTNMNMTLGNIGKVFNLDHSSVFHNNTRHEEDINIGYEDYKDIYESIKREFIFKIHTIDNTIQTLLDIITAENALRHDALIESSKKNKKLNKEIQYLKDQINILNK